MSSSVIVMETSYEPFFLQILVLLTCTALFYDQCYNPGMKVLKHIG
jgi:hypothetical protein